MKRSSCGSSATIANGLPALLGRRRERTREEFDAFCLSRHRYGQAACACDRLPPSELNGALVRRCSRNEICPAFRFATAAVLDDTTVGMAVGSGYTVARVATDRSADLLTVVGPLLGA